MSVQVSYKKQIAFFIILGIIFLAVVEITIRIYDYNFPNCRFLESEVFGDIDHDLRLDICRDNSGVKWETDPLHLVPNQNFKAINVNSDGFRGNELQIKPDYRIFVIGGSTTFGVGATSDFSTIPYLLQVKINEKFPNHKIEVINAVTPQAYSFTESRLIKEKILSHNPDMLIIYDGWNDLQHDYGLYSEGTDPILTDKIIRFIGKSDYVTPKVLLSHYFNLKYDSTNVIKFDYEYMDKKIISWKNTWQEICGLGEEYNFETVITLQPLVGTGNKVLTLEEQTHFEKYDGDSKIFHYSSYANALNELDTKCSMISDLRNVFDTNSETVFYDFGHLGDNGNRIVANYLYERILPIVSEQITN